MKIDSNSQVSMRKQNMHLLVVALCCLHHINTWMGFFFDKFGVGHEKFLVKVRISEVYPKNKSADLCFDLKVLAINDTLKMVGIVNALRHLGLKTPEALNNLISTKKTPISIQKLKDKVPFYMAVSVDVNREHFEMDDILPFFRNHCHKIPTWAKFACLLATQQISSAGAERVFSFLKGAFKETQAKALSD